MVIKHHPDVLLMLQENISNSCFPIWPLHCISHIADHLWMASSWCSNIGRASSRVCVCLSLRSITFEVNDIRHIDIWKLYFTNFFIMTWRLLNANLPKTVQLGAISSVILVSFINNFWSYSKSQGDNCYPLLCACNRPVVMYSLSWFYYSPISSALLHECL